MTGSAKKKEYFRDDKKLVSMGWQNSSVPFLIKSIFFMLPLARLCERRALF